MRSWIFVFSLCAATASFGQSSPQPPVNPFNTAPLPPAFNWPGTDFSRNPPAWRPNSVSPNPTIVLRETDSLTRKDRAKIDPGIIVHPPKSSFGIEPQGTPVAQNQYPGLRYLPIDVSTAKLEPIPIFWPDLKPQSTPAAWPKAKPLPFDLPSQNSASPSLH